MCACDFLYNMWEEQTYFTSILFFFSPLLPFLQKKQQTADINKAPGGTLFVNN